MADKTLGTLIFGFDIGIASVGWCVLAEDRILDLGVRCFEKAETSKEGESLNLARRSARLMRRRLRRRAWRLTKLARLLKRHGLIDDISTLKQPPTKGFRLLNLWQLRVDALDRRLDREEWARVIYHLCKHRGFHWISRAEEKKAEGDSKSEGGQVKKGLNDTQRRMEDKGYRSAAEMVLAEFPEQRNKQGDYAKALSRSLLSEELALLFQCQRILGNPHAGSEIEAAILGSGNRKSGMFWEQKPALAGADLLNMLGKCNFEKEEYRAPKASFTAERHVWLTRLNNLRIAVDGTTRPLNEAERRIAMPLPYQQAGDLTYRQLRSALTKAGLLVNSFRFAGLNYPAGKQLDEAKPKDPEAEKLIKLGGWHELRKKLKDKGLETEWESLAGAAIAGDPGLLDEVARILSVFKDGDEVTVELRKLKLRGGEQMVEALAEVSFEKFHAISIKALRKIVPYMEDAMRYDEACLAAGYHHSQLPGGGAGELKYLPALYAGREKDGRMMFNSELDVPKNPVVLRALNQARKVLNALVHAYGSPTAVHIEMARDLSRPLDERRKVTNAQDEYRERNEKDKAAFAAEYGIGAKSREFEKFQLYREQQGKCAYSLKALDLHRVLNDIGYAEVDHVLPYSRSYDDSKNNKVLALTEENRNKGNRTAFEYLSSFPAGEQGERWRSFVAQVETNKSYRLAKRTRLLRKDFIGKAAEEFRDRNLNDTRYICRFFKNYVERYLQIRSPDGGVAAKRCVVLSGQTTAFLRARWGLLKVRDESDRHHALDAAVVAACSHAMVKRLADYSRCKELAKVRDGFPDPESGVIVDPVMFQQLHAHFPDPWLNFRRELQLRLKGDDAAELRRAIAEEIGTYPAEALEKLRPLFVSRAPQRRNRGAAHKDTVYAQPESLKLQGGVTQKIPLASLTIKDLDKLIDPHRNDRLYAAIRERLEAHGGKAEKAFPSESPLRKPDRDGNPTGPVVRSVTMVIDKLSGIPIRGGIAKNDSMVRVDVFRHKKDGKFNLVPVYVHHQVAKSLPNRAIIQGKEETEWAVVDGTCDFCFSLHPSDLVRVALNDGARLGYFAGCDRSTGTISLWAHDRNQQVGKDGLIRSIGVKRAVQIEKFHVDVLGNIYPAPPEQRRGLA